MNAMNLNATMRLENQGFVNPLKAAQTAMGGLKTLAGSLSGPLAALGVSFAAFKSVQGIMEGLKGAFEMGKELKAQASITGQSVRDIVTLRKAYQEAGLDAGSLTQNLAMMQAALGGVNEMGEPTKHIFDQLGLSIEKLRGQSAVQQFESIGKAISKLNDQESKMAAVRGIYGRAGAQMLALFNNPSAMEEAMRLARSQADVYQRSAEIFARVSNSLEGISGKVRGMFAGMAEVVAPVLLPLLDKIKSVDSVNFGRNIAKNTAQYIQLVTAAFKTGNLGDFLGLSLQMGIFKVLPKLEAGLLNAFKAPIAYLQAGIEMGIEKLKPSNKGNLADWLHGFRLNQVESEAKETLKDPESSKQDIARAREDLANVTRSRAAMNEKHSGPTFDQILQQYMKQPVQFGFTNSDEIAKGNQVPAVFQKQWDDMVAQLKKSMGPLASFGSADAAPKPGDKSAELGNVKGLKLEEGDRLSKIGLFVGSTGPQAQYARETAANTGLLVNLTRQTLSLLSGRASTAGALPYAP